MIETKKGYDIADENSVHEFGVSQGEAWAADPETQGNPEWPQSYAYLGDEQGVPVGPQIFAQTPPDILADDDMLSAYMGGVVVGIENGLGDENYWALYVALGGKKRDDTDYAVLFGEVDEDEDEDEDGFNDSLAEFERQSDREAHPRPAWLAKLIAEAEAEAVFDKEDPTLRIN